MYFDGLKQEAARTKKLNNEKYDAYLESKKFKKTYPEEYKRLVDEALTKTAERQSEQSNSFNLWG